MNRRVLFELEKEYEKTLDWDREEIKKKTMPLIIPQGYFPPDNYVIQGLMPAPESNAPKNRGCKGCEFYQPWAQPTQKCSIKAARRIVLKGYCPKKFMKHSIPARRPIYVSERIVFEKETGRFKSVKSYFIPFCNSCDFYNKIDHYCALRAVGRQCVLLSKYNMKFNAKCKAVARK